MSGSLTSWHDESPKCMQGILAERKQLGKPDRKEQYYGKSTGEEMGQYIT